MSTLLDYDPSKHPTSAKTQTVAMWLFLASLVMLFAASMVGYVLIRVILPPPLNGAELVRTPMPVIFFASTVAVLAASVTIQWSLNAIRRERQAKSLFWLKATLALAAVFTVLQVPGLWQLFQMHVPRTDTGANLARLIAVFIILHAAHVLGGIVYLPMVVYRAMKGRYDHEHHVGIKHAAMYWHFLDAVWIVMFGMMLILG